LTPLSTTHWSELTFLVVDVEGNGHNPHEIIELASVPIRYGSIQTDAKQWLIRPHQSVIKQATDLHGITNEDLADKPTFQELAPTIQAALGAEILIGHYVQVDHELIKTQLPDWKPMLVLDTIKLAKAAAPNLKSYSLASLIAEFGITDLPPGSQHRAMYDAVAAAKLFLILVKKLDPDGQLTLARLAEIGASANDSYFSSAQGGLF
jgi:exodeoxyribonuclease X